MAHPTPARRPGNPDPKPAWGRPLTTVAAIAVLMMSMSCGRVAPRYEPARLTVESTPAGAAIHLDGVDTGQVTPFTFTDVAAARHVVGVRLADWHADPQDLPIDLAPLEDATVAFTLFQTGLRIASDPPGARILVDGVDSGRLTPAVVPGLAAGAVSVSLELDTWLCMPPSIEIEVRAGEVTEVPAGALSLRSRRTALMESFGNINCPTCAEAAENLVAVTRTEGFGPGRALFLEFSVNWPSPVDPFYLANPTENADRYLYYWVMGAPALYVDGALQAQPLNAGLTAAAVAARWSDDPGFLIDVDADFEAGAGIPATVTLTPLRAVDLTGCVLYVALYEDEVTFETAPGSNGQTVFHHMFRDRVDTPPALGALAAGEPATYEAALARGAATGDMTVVAFVQRVADKAILQAGSTLVPAPAAGGR